MSNNLVVVMNCSNEIEANLVVGELEDAGFEAVITSPSSTGMPYLSVQFVTGVDVAVREEDAEAALAFLQAQPEETDSE